MKHLVQRFKALGLSPPLAVKLEGLITKWERASGPEWTVKRLKSLKEEFLGILANEPRKASWVSRNDSGLPKGPFAELFRLGLSGSRGATKAINALMVYSSFVAESITDSQKEKFFGSMESEDITGIGITAEQCPIEKYDFVHLKEGRPWVNQMLSPESFQPGPDGKSYPETDTFISFVSTIASNPMMGLIRRHSRVFNEVFPTAIAIDMWNEGTVAVKYSMSPYNACIGKISFIQEPGFKLRAVANPNRVLQSALEPLKVALGEALSKVAEDCTFDQLSGVNTVQGWLNEGKMVHSVDLSDATNLFPLDFTVSCLRMLPVLPRDRYDSSVNLFAEASRMPFYSKIDGIAKKHKFTRGQPLGLGPSFFAFSLSHHSLLQSICKGLGLSDRPYRILGDDIVISSDQVYVRYIHSLIKLGCKVSEGKSFSSKEFAEFAGKLITKCDIIPQFKWRDLSDRNVVDFCRNIGPSSVQLLNNRQKELITFLSDVPTFMGGLGWNPQGVPLDTRLLEPFNQFILNRDLEILIPHQRVDRPLIKFKNDLRLRDLTPSYITVDGLKQIIPTRDNELTQWGTPNFWKDFFKAQEKGLPLEVLFLDKSGKSPFLDRSLLLPFIKEDTDPRQRIPWFDLLRLFKRNQASQPVTTEVCNGTKTGSES